MEHSQTSNRELETVVAVSRIARRELGGPAARDRPWSVRAWPAWAQFLLATGAVTLALGVRWSLDDALQNHALFLPLYAVLLPLLLLIRPAVFLTTALLGLLAVWYMFVPPRFSISIGDKFSAVEAVFVASSAVLATGAAWLSARAHNRARDTADALRASHARERAFVENLPVGVWFLDASGRIVFGNKAGHQIWCGARYVGPDQFGQYKAWRHGTNHQLNADEWAGARAIARNETTVNEELDIECFDGTRKTILNSAVPVRDLDGRLIGAVVFNQDITERKRAEQALRDSESRHRTLLNLLPVGVYSCDAAGLITYCNDEAINLWGRAPQLGDTDERFCGSEQMLRPDGTPLPHDQCPMAVALREGRSFRATEVNIRRPDGSIVTASVNIDPILDGAGRVTGAINVFHNVTQLKAAEQALRQSEERFRSLVSVITDVPWTTDAAGEFVTPQLSWEAYTGQPWEEHRGFGWAKMIHPDDREQVKELWSAAIAGRSVYRSRGRFWHAASRGYRYFEARATPLLNPDGSVREWVGTCTDVHEQRLAEQALRDADRRKDEFLAVLGHELRNPLAAIRTAMQMLVGSENDQQTVHHMHAIIERQSALLVRLIDDLLDVSRITRGRIELHKQRLDVISVICSAIEGVHRLASEHKIAIHTSAPDAPLLVNGDSVRLAQVFGNLLNNACKYTDPGGRVDVHASREGAEAVVRVRDTGVGIPADQLQRIFDMFVQVDPGGRRASGGLGIGLSLARKLVEMHGGSIDVHSEGVGHGSEFIVRLPLVVDLPSPGPPPRDNGTARRITAAQAGVKRRVLAVDDNRDALDALAALLRRQGHVVETAESGAEALAVAAMRQPEIILLDIGLPSMDGYEVARRIRREPWGSRVKLVAMTGWGQEQDKKNAADAGFDAHLTKPAHIECIEALLA